MCKKPRKLERIKPIVVIGNEFDIIPKDFVPYNYNDKTKHQNITLNKAEENLNGYIDVSNGSVSVGTTENTHVVLNTSEKTETEKYEMVNPPKHYNRYSKEVIRMMVGIWGYDAVINFCELNAFKYRMRMGTKPKNSIEQDLEKENWYLNMKEELVKEFNEKLMEKVKNCLPNKNN